MFAWLCGCRVWNTMQGRPSHQLTNRILSPPSVVGGHNRLLPHEIPETAGNEQKNLSG